MTSLADLQPGDTLEYRTLDWCPGYQIGSDGSIFSSLTGRTLKPCVIPGGYLQVLIYNGTRRSRKTRRVHSLVCEAFHGPKPSPAHQVAHWDGDPANNRPENLRWATSAENIGDKVRHGRVTRTAGEIDGMAKLAAVQVLAIRARHAAGANQYDLAVEYGVKQPTISNIITRKTWGHL